MKKTDMVDYRKFRLHKLNTPEFSHLKYQLYWPVFGLLFLTVERLWIRSSYYPVHIALDDMIPFCEYFIFPYLFWFVYLIGTLLYTLLFDVESSRRMMRFIILTYTAAMAAYILFPNCQELRPAVFARDTVLTQFVTGLYGFDTNTNVCPSMHVIGSLAAMFTAWHSKHFSGWLWRIAFAIMAVLISISTVFLKQHSVLDVIVALPICLIAYFAVFRGPNLQKKQTVQRAASF